MKDSRVQNLAKILVHYSVRAKKGQTVEVSGAAGAEPLIVAVYEEILKAGAFPVVTMTPDCLSEIFYKKGKPHHFAQYTRWQKSSIMNLDSTIRISCSDNTRALTSVDPKKQAQHQKTMKPLKRILLAKPWVLTLFPTQAFAQDADMSLTEFEDFVYSATFADKKDPIGEWKALEKRQAGIIRKLRGADKIRIVGDETDLSFSVKGRTFINSHGTHNMPCGEVFTGPVEDSAEGHIKYDYPVCHAGREVDGIRLVFKKGLVVEATATKNQKFLTDMLNMDPGARRLGELGIGTNYGIQRFIKNILFDEKIGGSVHLALGESYPETGGRNKSALHWDMIKDLRKGGTLYVNGKVFQKNGKFV